MPRARGKANYKVELLISIIEEKLPQGSMGWQEVAALYQLRSQERTARDHEDVKTLPSGPYAQILLTIVSL
jgi:hypothetical protein